MCGHTASLRKPVVDLDPEQFRARLTALLDKGLPDRHGSASFFWIPGNQPPWFDTGVELPAGAEVTVLTAGQVVLPTEPALKFHPDMQLWYRVGQSGEIFRGTRNSHSFRAASSGRLYLGNYFPGEWCTRTGGTSVGSDAFNAMQGGLSVMVLRWNIPVLQGLKHLQALGDVESLLASEIDRISHPAVTPAGWSYLWYLGTSEIFGSVSSQTEQRPHITCSTHRDAAILHKDVSVPLSPGTTLKWLWKVDTLPCQRAENTLQDHDYLSIAVEFDNGQDLTFLWSSQLPVDTGFRCPIPTWTAREMHVVARSGKKGLGEWCSERRDVFAYYERFIGTIGPRDQTRDALVVPPPTRIVRVWLIANSMFQQQFGQCEYGAIELHSGSRVTVVN